MRWLGILWLALCLQAQSTFQPQLAERPEVRKALALIDARRDDQLAEWIRIAEIASPSTKEQKRAEYLRHAMAKAGLTNIQTDAIHNVWGYRKGTGNGPTIVFAAHTDTVFPDDAIKVRRDNDRLYAPGIGDDTAALAAMLAMLRAANDSSIKTKGDIVFLASVQEEIGLKGMSFWMANQTRKPDMVVAVDVGLGSVWFGALRITQLKFTLSGKAYHTLESRDRPTAARAAARAISAVYSVRLPDEPSSLRLPVINVGMIHGGSVFNAVPKEVYFTVDLRSTQTGLTNKIKREVVAQVEAIAAAEQVELKTEESTFGLDYAKALPLDVRKSHPVVQNALAVTDFLKINPHKTEPLDLGSTDANIGVSYGIPSAAVGVVRAFGAHSREEFAEAGSIIPGTRFLLLYALSLAGVN